MRKRGRRCARWPRRRSPPSELPVEEVSEIKSLLLVDAVEGNQTNELPILPQAHSPETVVPGQEPGHLSASLVQGRPRMVVPATV